MDTPPPPSATRRRRGQAPPDAHPRSAPGPRIRRGAQRPTGGPSWGTHSADRSVAQGRPQARIMAMPANTDAHGSDVGGRVRGSARDASVGQQAGRGRNRAPEAPSRIGTRGSWLKAFRKGRRCTMLIVGGGVGHGRPQICASEIPPRNGSSGADAGQGRTPPAQARPWWSPRQSPAAPSACAMAEAVAPQPARVAEHEHGQNAAHECSRTPRGHLEFGDGSRQQHTA